MSLKQKSSEYHSCYPTRRRFCEDVACVKAVEFVTIKDGKMYELCAEHTEALEKAPERS